MDLKVRNTSEYEKFSIDDTLKALETSMNGLIESEVENRLKTFGYNEIVEKKKNPLLEFLLRYWGPMPWLLELAMALSFILRHYLEGIIIFVLLTVNAVIGQMHSLRQDSRTGQDSKAKITSRGSDDGHSQIHDVSWHSRIGSCSDIRFSDAYPGASCNCTYPCCYLSHGSGACCPSGSAYHSSGSMGVDFNAYKQISYTPFNPSIRRTEAIVEADGKQFRGRQEGLG